MNHYLQENWINRVMFGVMMGSLQIALVYFLLNISGCMPLADDPGPPYPTENQSENNNKSSEYDRGGSEGEIVLHMPVSLPRRLKCVQGVNGSYSHHGTSTAHDLDFDTSNSTDEELYAPVSGVVNVHTEDSAKNFGYHVNIDLGNGTYVVVAHMKRVLVESGSEIVAGQLIGYEGCTGFCTGDHVHIGLHRGNAAQKAEKGTSIPAKYWIQNNDSGRAVVKNGSDFICGIKALGDPVEGVFYTSVLPVSLWHPDGTLVKLPNSSEVYLLHENSLHWLKRPSVMSSFGFSFEDVVLISREEIACYTRGYDIDGELDLQVVSTSDGHLWMLVNDPNGFTYRQSLNDNSSFEVVTSWGLSGDVLDNTPIWEVNDSRFSSYVVRSGFFPFRTGTLIRESGSSAVYVISGPAALPVNDWSVLVKLGFANRSILWVDDGLIRDTMAFIGDCEKGYFCLDEDSIETCGGLISWEAIQNEASVSEERPSFVTRLQLDEGEFGIVYQPPTSIVPEKTFLEGEVFDRDGRLVSSLRTWSFHEGLGATTWKTKDLLPGDVVQVRAVIEAPRANYLSCEDGDPVGQMTAGYGLQNLIGEFLIREDDRCVSVFVVPYEASVSPPNPQPEPDPIVNNPPVGPSFEELMAEVRHRLVIGYEAPVSRSFESLAMFADSVDYLGDRVLNRERLGETSNDNYIVWGTNHFEDGDIFLVDVHLVDLMNDILACNILGGNFVAMLDGVELSTNVVSTASGCRYQVITPRETADQNSEMMEVTWTSLMGNARNLVMSGEHCHRSGECVSLWQEVERQSNTTSISHSIEGVMSGDTFRFSVEMTQSNGSLTWSCLGPYPNYTLTGRAEARVGSQNISVLVTPDPSGQTTGCGLTVVIP